MEGKGSADPTRTSVSEKEGLYSSGASVSAVGPARQLMSRCEQMLTHCQRPKSPCRVLPTDPPRESLRPDRGSSRLWLGEPVQVAPSPRPSLSSCHHSPESGSRLVVRAWTLRSRRRSRVQRPASAGSPGMVAFPCPTVERSSGARRGMSRRS